MTLRTRLLLGYAVLVLLLVATGVAGSYEFREISVLVNERLDHFTSTTKSANTLLRAVNQQDRDLLRAIIASETAPQSAGVQAAHAEFRAALARAHEIADSEQRALLQSIRELEPEFVAARDRVLAARTPAGPTRAADYESSFGPALAAIRQPCEALFAGSRQHMFDARDAVRDAANSGSILLGVLVTVGLLSLIALARSMRTHVLERLDELRRFCEAISSGVEHQRALLTGNDELAQLATQLNVMLDRQSALEGRLQGRLADDRRMLVGMLGVFADGALLLSPSGDLITWSGRLPEPQIVDGLSLRAAERNRMIGRGEAAPETALDWTGPEGSRWTVRRLVASGGISSGWLAEPETSATSADIHD